MTKGLPTPGFSGTNLACLRGERMVFARLDFQVAPGEALVLLGPNGSGKSSLLRVMAGLLKPFAGQLLWDGRPVSEDREGHAGRIHYVGHHDAIKPVLTVAENLRFWARLHGGASGDLAGALAGALERVNLAHLADTPGKLLSAGQKRRLNLGRLWAAPAPVWLLDEPTTALDKASIRRLEEAIAAHRDGGGMVVLSTHADINLPGHREMHMDQFTPDPAEHAFGGWE